MKSSRRSAKAGWARCRDRGDPQIERDFAIKVSAQQFTDRFEREVRAICALNHPNICTLYHVGPNYLVMELIEGPTPAAIELIEKYARSGRGAFDEDEFDSGVDTGLWSGYRAFVSAP